jgi:hypothetical protein
MMNMTANWTRLIGASRKVLVLAVALAPSLAAAETGRYGAEDYSVVYNDPNTTPPNEPVNVPVDELSQNISYRFSFVGPTGGSFYNPDNWEFSASGRPGGFINGNAITGTFDPETPSYVADMSRPDGSSAGTPREGYDIIHHIPQYTTVIGNGSNVVFDPVGEGQSDTVYSVNLFYVGGLTGAGNVGGSVTLSSGVIEGRAAFFYSADGTTVQRQPARFIIGRNNKATATGYFTQTGGTYRQVLYYQTPTNPGTSNFIQIGSGQTIDGVATGGRGVYDYSGGILDNSGVGANNQVAMILGDAADGEGTFIMRSPTAPGYVRVRHFLISNNSRTTGTLEFQYGAGGYRPIQVMDGLNLSNTTVANSRSSMLDFKLDAAPTLTAGVPLNIGLIDVDFDGDGVGTIGGSGGGTSPQKFAGNFYATDNTTRLAEGTTISAMFGGNTYNWTISYTGNITWSDANNSVVSAVTGAGTGKDVVLIGQSSVIATPTGDFNSDGDVDGDDLIAWTGGFGTGSTRIQGNSDNDGDVDGSDFLVWQQQFGTMPAAGAVPEPASCIMAISMAVLLVRIARRCQ